MPDRLQAALAQRRVRRQAVAAGAAAEMELSDVPRGPSFVERAHSGAGTAPHGLRRAMLGRSAGAWQTFAKSGFERVLFGFTRRRSAVDASPTRHVAFCAQRARQLFQGSGSKGSPSSRKKRATSGSHHAGAAAEQPVRVAVEIAVVDQARIGASALRLGAIGMEHARGQRRRPELVVVAVEPERGIARQAAIAGEGFASRPASPGRRRRAGHRRN